MLAIFVTFLNYARARIPLTAFAAVSTAFVLGIHDAPARSQTPPLHTDGELVSSLPYSAPSVRADAKLLVYYMPGIHGEPIRASTLLFVPHGNSPPDGWPVVAWAHGTTTPGKKSCAPSLTPIDLDGGLTADGFKSNYAYEIASLVRARYAVVAPDFEGLGTVADVPYPYFNAPSLARSLISAVRAARHAVPSLSARFAVVGHSDGGHAVLGVEAFAARAPELKLEAIVALAPFTSISATVLALNRMALKDPRHASGDLAAENFNVALMAIGLRVESPAFDLHTVMGDDLLRLLPDFVARCSVKAIAGLTAAVKARPQTFAGFKEGWDSVPQMKAFLEENDPNVTPGYHLRLPILIEQGSADAFVFEPIDAAFVAKLRAAGTRVIYKVYAGDDHFQIIPDGNADTLHFLATYLHSNAKRAGT